MEPFPFRPRSPQAVGFRAGALSLGWLIADRLVRLGVGFVVSAMVARHLGPQEFGRLSYALSWVALVGFVVPLGLDGILRREVLQRPEAAGSVIATVLVLRVAALLVSFCVVSVVIAYTPAADRRLLWAVCGGMLVPLAATWDVVLESAWDGRRAFFARMASTGVGAMARLILLWEGAGVDLFAMVVSLESVCLVAATVMAFRASPARVEIKGFDRELASRLIREAWPLILASLSVTLYGRFDQVLLRLVLGDASVGCYAAAVRLSEIGHMLPMLSAATVFPLLVAASRAGPAAERASVQQYLDGSALAGYAWALAMSAGASLWIRWVFGEQFSEAAPVLVVHAWSAVFVFLGVARTQVLTLGRHSLIQLLTTVMGAAVNVVANIVLMPRMGVSGAAIAAVCAQGSAAWLSLALFGASRNLFRQIGMALFVPFRWCALARLIRSGWGVIRA